MLIAALAAAAAASVLIGGSALTPHDVVGALLHPKAASVANTIVWQLRMPRVCIAAVVGASLALCGALLQGMLRNPLVDPYLTGVSAGSAAAIAIAVLAGVSAALTPAIGFVAGLAAALLVATLARRGTGIDANPGTKPVRIPGLIWGKQMEDPMNPRYSKGGPGEITFSSSSVSGLKSQFSYTFPAHSVTSLVLSRR